MIRSFANKRAAAIFMGIAVRGLPPDIQKRARQKLKMIDAARDIADLRSPPGNRLEELKGDRRGQYSIRVNDQWRICCRFVEGDAYDVQITDYH